MTTEQRNDLCIEWEQTTPSLREQLLTEYQLNRAENAAFADWEDYIAKRLGLLRFWESVGLA